MNQALGNVGATVTYGASIEPQPVGQHASLAELSTAMDAGQVQLLVILGNNPVFTAPADVKFGERLSKSGAGGLPQPLSGRDVGARALEHPRHAPARNMGRSARVRRDGDADAAAHRAALRRALGARSAGDADERNRGGRRSTSSRTTGRGRSAALRDGPSATPMARRSATPTPSGSRPCTTDSFAARRRRAVVRQRRSSRLRLPRWLLRAQRPRPTAGAAPVSVTPPSPAEVPPAPALAVHPRTPAPTPAPAPAPAGRRTRAGVPARSDGLGRPLRQQRLAAGSAEAADEADVGHGGVD